MKQIRKRDGRIKSFDFDRIVNALTKAYDEVGEYQIGELMTVLSSIGANIDTLDKDILDVEEIQDVIIDSLKEVNPKVAESYASYRYERTRIRECNSQLIKGISGLIDNTNLDVLLENANKKSELLSTQRDLMAGEVSKYITDLTLPKHLVDAHRLGALHLHDKDYYAQGMYNCALVNLSDMFENGTVINKKKIRTPKSLRTAMTLATQIAAQVASFQYGE